MGKRRMVPDERRSLILAAARELFSQRPYAGVPAADVAAAAGVSPPLIVFHFGSKRALCVAVIQAAAGAIRDGPARPGSLSPAPGAPSPRPGSSPAGPEMPPAEPGGVPGG